MSPKLAFIVILFHCVLSKPSVTDRMILTAVFKSLGLPLPKEVTEFISHSVLVSLWKYVQDLHVPPPPPHTIWLGSMSLRAHCEEVAACVKRYCAIVQELK